MKNFSKKKGVFSCQFEFGRTTWDWEWRRKYCRMGWCSVAGLPTKRAGRNHSISTWQTNLQRVNLQSVSQNNKWANYKKTTMKQWNNCLNVRLAVCQAGNSLCRIVNQLWIIGHAAEMSSQKELHRKFRFGTYHTENRMLELRSKLTTQKAWNWSRSIKSLVYFLFLFSVDVKIQLAALFAKDVRWRSRKKRRLSQ